MDFTMPDPGAIRAGLAQHAFQRLLRAFTRDAHQSKLVERKRLRRRLVLLQRRLQRHQHLLAVAPLFHVDEVHHDDAAEIAQTNLPHDLLHGFQVGLDDRVFQARRALAHEFPGVHVDGHQRFGMVDDDVSAGLQPYFGAQRLVQFMLDAELLEDRLLLGIQLDLARPSSAGSG